MMARVTDPDEHAGHEKPSLPEATKMVLRRMANSVAIVTCKHGDERFGMAATAVNALSLDPPSMLVCINQSASVYPALAAGAAFSINLLGAQHEPLGRAFGGGLRGKERFSVGEWETDQTTGAPILRDAQGTLICANESSLRYGSHEIFVGRVLDVRRAEAIDPLVYFDGRYIRLP